MTPDRGSAITHVRMVVGTGLTAAINATPMRRLASRRYTGTRKIRISRCGPTCHRPMPCPGWVAPGRRTRAVWSRAA